MTPATLEEYEQFIYSLRERFPALVSSTLRIIRTGSYSGRLVGILTFTPSLRLDVAELIDFDAGHLEILQYGYVVWQDDERLYWYDSQEHPNDPTLASTHPHHKHIPPDIKHNRIPAPGFSFNEPNLLFLIHEIEALLCQEF